MDLAAFQILILSLLPRRPHTEVFRLAYLMNYDDTSFCAFFWAGLNIQMDACLFGDGSRGKFEEVENQLLLQFHPTYLSETIHSFTEPTVDNEPEPTADP